MEDQRSWMERAYDKEKDVRVGVERAICEFKEWVREETIRRVYYESRSSSLNKTLQNCRRVLVDLGYEIPFKTYRKDNVKGVDYE